MLNGQVIHVTETETLQGSVVASGFPYDRNVDPNNNLAEWARFAVQVRGVRRLGSAALDMCYVAAGRLDGYWEMKLSLWDLMAGVLCVSEAGGMVSNFQGDASTARYADGRILASNGRIHAQMMEVLNAED